MFFYLRGQTLNVLSAYDQHAEDCLSKAVKLDPSLIEAWNELGESYWKNRNIEAAANCFTGAIAKVYFCFGGLLVKSRLSFNQCHIRYFCWKKAFQGLL